MSDFIRRNACKSHDFAILKPFHRPRRSDAGEVNIVKIGSERLSGASLLYPKTTLLSNGHYRQKRRLTKVCSLFLRGVARKATITAETRAMSRAPQDMVAPNRRASTPIAKR
jgi:hypothetical protein